MLNFISQEFIRELVINDLENNAEQRPKLTKQLRKLQFSMMKLKSTRKR